MRKWVELITVAVAVGLVSFCVSVPASSGWHVTQWSPAWVQAIGSVAAILVAIYVPYKLDLKRQSKEVEERNRIESVTHYVLALEANVILNAVVQFKDVLNDNPAQGISEPILMKERYYEVIYKSGIERFEFLTPPYS